MAILGRSGERLAEDLVDGGSGESGHFELIEGELYNKMGKKRLHTMALTLVRIWLSRTFGDVFVDTKPSIDVAPEDNPTSEPEPDAIVLTKPTWEFVTNPKPAEIRLVVEVADSTLSFDKKTKAGLYARAGIAEYWVLDANAHSLIVHLTPANGAYQSIKTFAEGDRAESNAVGTPFRVSSLFERS